MIGVLLDACPKAAFMERYNTMETRRLCLMLTSTSDECLLAWLCMMRQQFAVTGTHLAFINYIHAAKDNFY